MTPPTQPTLTDERLDRLIRQVLAERAEDVAAAAVSADAMAERIAGRLRPSPLGRAWVLLAATAVLAVVLIGGVLAVGGAVRPPWVPLPATPPPATPTPMPDAAPWLQLPAPSAREGLDVLGWPDTDRNAPGLYSFDGSTCAGSFCSLGFMHNGYGSGAVEITIGIVLQSATPDGGTAVTVAGHDGTYRRIDAGREEWLVDIEGRTIAIRLTARPGTSQADLDDAYSIIGSIRDESQDRNGLRLVFILSTDDWDSG